MNKTLLVSTMTYPLINVRSTDEAYLDERFKYLKECGIEAVELDDELEEDDPLIQKGQINHFWDKELDELYEYFTPMKNAARRNGIAFSQMHSVFPLYIEGNDEATEYVRMATEKSLAVAAFLNCPAIVAHPYSCTDKEKEAEINLALYRRLMPVAKQYGVKICWQVLPEPHYKRLKSTANMQRILIIGNAGSGKTTFARLLAEKLSLPLVHLDRLYWCGNWEHLSREEFDAALQVELDKPEWIIDGNFNRTISHRLQYCDTVFFFDLPTISCLWGITKRIVENYGKTRADMGGNCPEFFDVQKRSLYRNVLGFNKAHRVDYYQLLSGVAHARVIVFKSRKQVAQFLKNL